jgi:ABC-2 type transport system ATP-binding protein
MESQIAVQNLCKAYRVSERDAGLGAALKSLFRRRYRTVSAVDGIGFQIGQGEMVGLIGPNGAGKTTTLKMLCGLLYPTSGQASVLGFVPWERKAAYLRQISMVLGNKSQLSWDIPPMDSFRVLGEIYGVPPKMFRQTVDDLVDLLEAGALLTKPVRSLSLGERMKCELIASLLHRPRVLYLDEPTLGLDVSMQVRLRRFLVEYNRHACVTVVLTSHYMADVVALCSRVMLLHHGELLYDGDLAGLANKLAPFKLIRIHLANGGDTGLQALAAGENVDIVECDGGRVTMRVPRADAPSITSRLLRTFPIADLSVEDPPIEAVIDQIYQEGTL